MKKIIGFAVLGLSLSMPIHAQRTMAGGSGPSSNNSGGTGGGPIGGGTGSTTFRTLPSIPRAQFLMTDISGGDSSFFPSSFMQFDKGIEEGKAALAAQRKTLGEVALEYRHTEKPRAKLTMTQDAFGNAVIERH
jgi:hypothetical protein